MTNFTLRLPQDLGGKLAALRPRGQSRHSHILDILADFVDGFDPQLVVGYVELHSGEVAPDALCSECNMAFGGRGVFLGFTADLKSFGPVCGLCASTE